MKYLELISIASKNTTIDYFKTNELNQMELKVCIPLVYGSAEKSNNAKFMKELND